MIPSRFTSPLTQQIAEFLIGIGIDVRSGDIAEDTFLPGVQIDHGTLLIDETRLAYPSDLLHEAGHLAVVPPERRNTLHMHAGDDPAEEMMAIAWSYAAAMHIGIDAKVLFHDGGYRGWGDTLATNFSRGQTVGVPTLAWIGLTHEQRRADELGVPPYPHMIRWLREDPVAEQPAHP